MPFRPAIEVEPAKLSAAFRAELAPLRGARPLAFTLQLVRVWLVIVTAIVAVEWIDTYHPNVSFSNLGRVHRLYCRQGLLDESAVFNGYGAYLRHLQGQTRSSQS